SVAPGSSTKPQTSFTAEAGQTYNFRLTVTDAQGAQGIARVTIAAPDYPRVPINRVTASTVLIEVGETSTLNYAVENADTVTISGVDGPLSAGSGTVEVSPTETTTYTLTATNATSEETAIVTVAVNRQLPRFVTCGATPVTII